MKPLEGERLAGEPPEEGVAVVQRIRRKFWNGYLVFLLVVGLGMWLSFWRMNQVIDDGDAQWATAEMVTEYWLEREQWPESWEDLWPYFRLAKHRGRLTFGDIERRVLVEFERLVELEVRVEDPEMLPDLIRLKNGKTRRWKDGDPNVWVNRAARTPLRE